MVPRIVSQLLYQSPMLLILVVGIVFAIMFYAHSPSSALFCLLGCAIMLLTALATTSVQAVVMERTSSMKVENINTLLSTVSMVGGVTRAVGLGLIIAAVFMGRRRTDDSL